jgi:uncharacterized protein
MAKGLRIASDLELPLEAAETTWAILGKKGSGKSTTAVDLVEEVLKHAQIPVAVLDPTGVWWGIRSSADGKSAGFPLTIFGGDHKDAPLEASAGELMADVVAEDRASCVFDLSYFNVRELQRFAYDFLSRLYLKNRHAMFLVLDEADDFAPQVIRGGEKGGYAERMLGAAERLVKQGRVRGIAPCFITQRPASLNKNVLSQIDSLVVMRLLSPHDRDAIKEWVKYNGTAEQLAELQADLATLDTGTGYIWSPETLDMFRKVAFRPSETFDSRRKPRAGKQIAPPKVLAAVDLKKLEHKMSALIDRAKADDPKELRAEIARLKKELSKGVARFPSSNEAAKQATSVDHTAIARAVEKAIAAERKKWASELRKAQRELDAWYKRFDPTVRAMSARLGFLESQASARIDVDIPTFRRRSDAPIAVVHANGPFKPETLKALVDVSRAAARHIDDAPAANGVGSLGAGERKVLIALAQNPEDRLDSGEIMILVGQKLRTIQTYLSRLRAPGFIEGDGSAGVQITQAGIEALGGEIPRLPKGAALREYWTARLPDGESKLLRSICEAYPDTCSMAQLIDATGQALRTVQTYISRLRARRLIEGNDRAGIRASENLF